MTSSVLYSSLSLFLVPDFRTSVLPDFSLLVLLVGIFAGKPRAVLGKDLKGPGKCICRQLLL